MGPSGPGVEIIRKRYSSKDLMKILRRDGWNLVNVKGTTTNSGTLRKKERLPSLIREKISIRKQPQVF